MNKSTCAVLLFYQAAVNGHSENESSSKWVGVNNVSTYFTKTITAIDEIKDKLSTSFNDDDNNIDGVDEFVGSLQTSFDTYFGTKLVNPNASPSQALGVNQISPGYITKYGNYDKSGTTLNAIYQEFDNKLSSSIKMREEAKIAAEEVSQYAEEIKGKLEEIKDGLLLMSQPFNKFATDSLDPWIKIVR